MLIEVNGKKIELRNLEKEIYPGVTKARLIEYYTKTFPLVKRFLERPVALKRCPDGPDSCFFQKNFEGPEWFKRFSYYSESTDESISWAVPSNLEDLVYLGELATLEIHMTLSRNFRSPDIMVWDLDPEKPAGIEETIEIAKEIKMLLDGLGIKSYPKFSGKRGVHILVPVKNATWEGTRNLVHSIGIIVSRDNKIALSEWIKHADRKGKVFIDYLQNAKQKTIAIPYSPRVSSLNISIPVSWKDIEKISPNGFTLEDLDWIEKWKDPWTGFWDQALDMAEFKNKYE